jgi:hypothetical protein
MPRFISVTVALIATIALLSAGSYVLARWYGWDALASISGHALQVSLYTVVICCAYACLVGVYHTILSVTGLDREKEEPEPPHVR